MSDIQAIKYRLVGAVVIVVGFSCVWWLLLDHEEHRRIQETQVEIPQKSFSVERFDIDKPKPLGLHPQTKALEPEKIKSDVNNIAAVEIKEDVITPVTHNEEKPAVQQIEKTPEPAKPAAPAVKNTSFSSLDEKGLPEAWVLQLASLKSQENAKQLQKKLLNSSYPAYVKSVKTADGVIYRVLVGPKLDRTKAEQMAKSIETEHAMKSIIVKYQTGYEQ
jgi:DedD protein